MKHFERLDDKDILYICNEIGGNNLRKYYTKFPKEFSKLKKGFRVEGLTDSQLINLTFDNRNKPLVRSLIDEHLNVWLKQINKIQENSMNKESLASVLASSHFHEKPQIYFILSMSKLDSIKEEMICTICDTCKSLGQLEATNDNKTENIVSSIDEQGEKIIAYEKILNKQASDLKELNLSYRYDLENLKTENGSLAKELNDTRILLDGCSPKNLEKNKEYQFTSVCEVYSLDGEKRLKRRLIAESCG